MGHWAFGKKGFEFLTNWFAILFAANLVFSFFIGRILVSEWVTYLIAAVVAVVIGRLLYTSRHQNVFPYYSIAFAFWAGYMAGHRVGNGIAITLLFAAVMLVTYKISKRVMD